MENPIDLVNYIYYIILDIIERKIYIKKQKRKIKIVNIYNNKLSK